MLDLGDGEVNELEMVLVSTVSRGRDMIYLHILRDSYSCEGRYEGKVQGAMGMHRRGADLSGHQTSVPKEVTLQLRPERWETKRQRERGGEGYSRNCHLICHNGGLQKSKESPEVKPQRVA